MSTWCVAPQVGIATRLLCALCSARAAHQKTLEYISTSIMTEGLPMPPPAVLPAKFKGRPHAYVEYLNGGLLPYHDCGESAYNIVT